MVSKYASRSLMAWVISLVVIAGCQSGSSDNPIAPTKSEPIVHSRLQAEDSRQGSENGTIQQSGPFIVRDLIGGLTRTVTGLVTPVLGGVLDLSQSRLVIPPFAVVLPTLVRFSMINETPEGLMGGLNRVYEFSPDGLNFLAPSTLYVTFSDARLGNQDPSDFRFYYFNEGQHRWEAQPTQVDTVNHRFVVTLSHFSRYAFGR